MPAYDDHYIELMQAQMTREAFMGFLRGNIIKYASQFGKTDDESHVKTATKIRVYAEWLEVAAMGNKVNPHE